MQASHTSTSRPDSVAVIVSTYNQPAHLDRCLFALGLQDTDNFAVLIADDGSGAETRSVIEAHDPVFRDRLKHIWQPDKGFRKTLVLNRAVHATDADYLVFIDGDCVAHPGFVAEHLRHALPRHYLNGALIRLNARQTGQVAREGIASGEVFTVRWLAHAGWRLDRRYLKLALPRRARQWLNDHSPTTLYWLGANASCWREDCLQVNGFDNRFGYGYEDGDFGNRLALYGVTPLTVRWTANALHLDHGRPYRDPNVIASNRKLQLEAVAKRAYRTRHGLDELT
ncbi:glycosyltransferase [Marinihelvus fidelis]|uniref:Glycosyltransferase n=1 Tax=Marinihelvus fidelis TaxID=2613842 RepID=A0A5N0TG64_9GAMM|nr:glycosyltransferase [Marinihelvus fidelis]KAA9134075.1 glycosyltransferase [Marinihelvus fidelis]